MKRLAIILLISSLISCSPALHKLKHSESLFFQGDTNHCESFDLLPKMKVDKMLIKIPAFEILIVNSERVEATFEGKKRSLRGYISQVMVLRNGKAIFVKRIVLTGKELGGKIYLNPAVLVEEIEHLIRYQDERLVNPDEKYR